MQSVKNVLELLLPDAARKKLSLSVQLEQKSDFEHYIGLHGNQELIN